MYYLRVKSGAVEGDDAMEIKRENDFTLNRVILMTRKRCKKSGKCKMENNV